jgi:hypothetical protein
MVESRDHSGYWWLGLLLVTVEAAVANFAIPDLRARTRGNACSGGVVLRLWRFPQLPITRSSLRLVIEKDVPSEASHRVSPSAGAWRRFATHASPTAAVSRDRLRLSDGAIDKTLRDPQLLNQLSLAEIPLTGSAAVGPDSVLGGIFKPGVLGELGLGGGGGAPFGGFMSPKYL